ncbi:hypothetical protein F4860DRAFT_513585 [Xylaria cubensis]|nr:hypothetical protein F4860DRAFT_513585 [Xylaria cubensis]
MDQNWDRTGLKLADLSKQIISIHLIAYPSPSSEDGYEPFELTNHWCFFLEFKHEKSVRLEIVPGCGSNGLRGKVKLTSKTHACTTNDLCKLSFQVHGRLSLEEIIEIVQSKGRQRYQFAPGWEGCRFWNFTLMQDFEAHNIVSAGAANQALNSMAWFYHSVRGANRRDMKIGTFLG